MHDQYNQGCNVTNYGKRSLFIPGKFTGVGPGTVGTGSVFGLKAPMVPGALEAQDGSQESYQAKPGFRIR